MADISFPEESAFRTRSVSEQKSFLLRTVLATGFVKTERAAEQVLLGIAVLSIAAATWIFIFSGSNSGSKVPQSVIDAAMQHAPTRSQ